MKKVKILIFVFLALVLLLVAGGVVYFIYKSRDQVVTMQNALAALAAEDYDNATKLLEQVLAKDANNETATVKLAEICEKRGNWLMSTFYWNRATSLNNLNSAYEENFWRTALRGRFFDQLASSLGRKRYSELSDELKCLYIYSLLRINNQQKGISLWDELNQEKPEIVETPWGRLIRVAYFGGDQTVGWFYDELAELRKAEEPAGIAQEALVARANLNRMLKQYADEEKDWQEFAQENYYVGTPLLGEFYINHFKYLEAIDLLEPYVHDYPNSALGIALGEMMVFTEQGTRLATLATYWQGLNGRNNLKTSYYLDALHKFVLHELEELPGALHPIRGQINTPLAAYVAMVSDVQVNDTAQLENDLRTFAAYPPLFALRDRAHMLVVLYLQDRVKAGDSNAALARLADGLLNARLSEEDVYLPRLISMITKLQNNSLTQAELDAVMYIYTDDQTCLQVGAFFHYSRGNYAESLKYLNRLEELGFASSLEQKRLAIADLYGLGQLDEACTRSLSLFEESHSGEDFFRCFQLLFANQRKEELQRLGELLPEEDALPNAREILAAGNLLLDGKQDEAMALLEKLDSANPDMLYFAGQQLASAGRVREAIAKLSKISPELDTEARISTVLARLYIENAEWEKARDKAAVSVRRQPASVEANLYMAKCFRHDENWQKALEYSKPYLWSGKGEEAEELRAVWIWATENNIRESFDSHLNQVVMRLCRDLQNYDPENAVAAEYSEKVSAQLAPGSQPENPPEPEQASEAEGK